MSKQNELKPEQIELLKELYFEVAQKLIERLENIKDKDNKSIPYEDKVLSVNDIITAIKNIEPPGVEHVKMHIDTGVGSAIHRLLEKKRKKAKK